MPTIDGGFTGSDTQLHGQLVNQLNFERIINKRRTGTVGARQLRPVSLAISAPIAVA
ncbi:MAG: hypothetical protein WCI73_00490 [Phycisphaerae bacterium]